MRSFETADLVVNPIQNILFTLLRCSVSFAPAFLFRSLRCIEPHRIVISKPIARIGIGTVDLFQDGSVTLLLKACGVDSLPEFGEQFQTPLEDIRVLNISYETIFVIKGMRYPVVLFIALLVPFQKLFPNLRCFSEDEPPLTPGTTRDLIH